MVEESGMEFVLERLRHYLGELGIDNHLYQLAEEIFNEKKAKT